MTHFAMRECGRHLRDEIPSRLSEACPDFSTLWLGIPGASCAWSLSVGGTSTSEVSLRNDMGEPLDFSSPIIAQGVDIS